MANKKSYLGHFGSPSLTELTTPRIPAGESGILIEAASMTEAREQLRVWQLLSKAFRLAHSMGFATTAAALVAAQAAIDHDAAQRRGADQ